MHPRRYSQIERALQTLDKSPSVDILKEDQHLLFLFKKTERIVAALYVITGLFPEAEPLKWRLRESGTSFIKHILSFTERATVHSKEFLSDTYAELAHLFSLVDLAYVADLISPMNFSVLKKELETVQGIIEGKWRTGGVPLSPPFFDDAFFGISKELFSEPKDALSSLSSSLVGGLSDFERLKREHYQKDIYKGHDIKDNVLHKKADIPAPSVRRVQRKIVSQESFTRVKEERQQHILTVLKQQTTGMIKDFSAGITGCSEKTIQRLLTEMVENGALIKEGDRRWSRYSIASGKEGLPDPNQEPRG